MKLTRAEDNQRDTLVVNLELASAELQRAIDEANTQVNAILEALNLKVEKYNDVLSEAQEFANGIQTRLQDDWDEKSERWQDGEKGQSATDLINEWGSIDLEPIDEFEFDGFEVLDLAHRDDLENLPHESE